MFSSPGHVPVIHGNPDLHFEGAGKGPVVITWIGREHELYSASLISFVEYCVTFRHDRRLLSLFGFVHNWPTSRWFATKKENRFSLNGNGNMSSFLGQQFYRSTLYLMKKEGKNNIKWESVSKCVLYSHIHIQIYAETSTDNIRTSMNKRTHFFIKIYLSHFILKRVILVVCERWAGDGDRLLHIDPKFFWP